jgi:hypothetical protein
MGPPSALPWTLLALAAWAFADRGEGEGGQREERAVTSKPTGRRDGPNRLASETSPYLLQHADNPVDWYPWGPEALERAKKDGKPIFLSIGYSACHWCHVMEHESFENEEIAKVLNEHFVSIKVDREERPDLDEIYMTATQMLTGRGGWPMSVFLTPDLRPIFAGTYFPPEDRWGMAGFPTVLERVAELWRTRREEVENSAGEITRALVAHTTSAGGAGADGALDASLLERVVEAHRADYDPAHGGFGGAPKFPPSMALELLLRRWRASGDAGLLSVVEHTLDEMARGGMVDQLGGGFHRYSTDERWLVPHFEKMLYDNALLARVYLDAFEATGKPQWERVVRETLDYVLREMTSPEGGFTSSQDADSEGEEGKFFVWTPEEIRAVLGEEEAPLVERAFGVTAHGNFEGSRTVLHLPLSLRDLAVALDGEPEAIESRIAAARRRLFEAREKRVHPGLDDKILAAWNGLMLSAMARAGGALEEPRYLRAAQAAGSFLLSKMRDGKGRLFRSFRAGEARHPAYLDDYACVAEGLLDLYEADFDPRWFAAAREIVAKAIDLFWDEKEGGFFYTARDHEELIARTKSLYDNAVPSGNSTAAVVLLRLAAATGEAGYRERAERTLRALRGKLERAPRAFPYLACALDRYLESPREVAIVGPRDDPPTRALLAVVRGGYDPNLAVALLDPAAPSAKEAGKAIPLLEGRTLVGGKPAAYFCRNFACEAPTTDPSTLAKQLGRPERR